MNTAKALSFAAAAGVVALNMGMTLAAYAEAPAYGKVAGYEKCAGTFVAAGKNDCAAGSHECAGQSKKVEAANWIFVPAGTCEKISGSKTVETVKPQG